MQNEIVNQDFPPVELLTNPKEKMSGSVRRQIMRSRERVVTVGPEGPLTATEKLFKKLQGLSMKQLARRIVQSVRRQRKGWKVIEKLSINSPFRLPMLEQVEGAEKLERMSRLEIQARVELQNCPRDGNPNNDNEVTGPIC